MRGIKSWLQSFFPKICLACRSNLASNYSPDLCLKCQSQVQLKVRARCMVCSLDQTSCQLCYGLPSAFQPHWILVALEPMSAAYQLVNQAYTLAGWRSHQALVSMLWARYLTSCELPPTLLIALPDPQGWLGSSHHHVHLARLLARHFNCHALSWRQGVAYKAKAGDRILFVAWQANFSDLVHKLQFANWQEATQVGALVALTN